MGGVGRRVQKTGTRNEGIRKNPDIVDVEILPGKGFGLRFHWSDRLHRDARVGLEPNGSSLGSDDGVTKGHGDRFDQLQNCSGAFANLHVDAHGGRKAGDRDLASWVTADTSKGPIQLEVLRFTQKNALETYCRSPPLQGQ